MNDASGGNDEGEGMRTHPSVKAMFHVERNPVTNMRTRVCQVCKHSRPVVLFGSGRGRRGVTCMACFEREARERRIHRREQRRELSAVKQAPHPVRRRLQKMLGQARMNAWRNGLLYDLSERWVMTRLLAGRCEVTGIPFDFVGAAGRRSPFIPSLDRRDPHGGYVESNCQIVVWMYNMAKGDSRHEDVVRMAEALIAREA